MPEDAPMLSTRSVSAAALDHAVEIEHETSLLELG